MNRYAGLAMAGLLCAMSACTSATRSYARDGSGKVPAAPSRADTLRGRALAKASLNPGGRATLTEGSGKIRFPIEAGEAEEQGSVILSFIVLPNGRIDRESRTIVYLQGHPLFAQAACDFLLEARVTLQRPSAEPAFASYAIVFNIRNLPKPPPVGEQLDEMMGRLNTTLFTRTQAEREAWVAARPSCSALKKRDM